MNDPRYRILSLTERRTVVHGITLKHARHMVDRTMEKYPYRRYEIRLDVES